MILGDGDIIYYDLIEEEMSKSALLRTSYASKTATGYFYIVSSGETVAEFSLSGTFAYDGNTVWTESSTGTFKTWIGNYANGGSSGPWSGNSYYGWNWVFINICM